MKTRLGASEYCSSEDSKNIMNLTCGQQRRFNKMETKRALIIIIRKTTVVIYSAYNDVIEDLTPTRHNEGKRD